MVDRDSAKTALAALSGSDQASDARSSARLAAGDAIRRRVLGNEHVDASRAAATDFRRPLQELVTEYCWGAVWTRPELPPKVRSLVNIGMLTALGKPEELRLHVRGALNNGCSVEEVREVLLQTAIYCGVPAALDATRHAEAAIIQQTTHQAKG